MRDSYAQYTLFVADMMPDYPVEWEILPPVLFNRLVNEWRSRQGNGRHLIETKGRMYVRRTRRNR